VKVGAALELRRRLGLDVRVAAQRGRTRAELAAVERRRQRVELGTVPGLVTGPAPGQTQLELVGLRREPRQAVRGRDFWIRVVFVRVAVHARALGVERAGEQQALTEQQQLLLRVVGAVENLRLR